MIAAAFQFHFMAFAVIVIDRCGPSSEICPQLQLKKNAKQNAKQKQPGAVKKRRGQAK